MKKMGYAVLSVFVIATLAFVYSCKGNKSAFVFLPGSATGFYVADDTSSSPTGTDPGSDPGSLYSQVTVTVDSVRLVNLETNAECDILLQPITISSIQNVLQFINIGQCAPGPYNRIQILLNRNTEITNAQGLISSCTLTSFTEKGNGKQPDRLFCDANDDFCELDLNGAVNVLLNEGNKFALNFRVKNLEVADFGEPSCTATLKVSPLNASQMKKLGDPEVISGIVSRVDTTNDTFDLCRGNQTFSVLYSGITSTELEDLLANADGLRTKVTSSTGIDLVNKSVVASSVEVK